LRVVRNFRAGNQDSCIEDSNICFSFLCPGPILQQILNTNLQLEEVPAQNAAAEEIRIWMHTEANQPLLQRITRLDLKNCRLTSVPEEIGLCRGVQWLNLESNQLTSLPERIFRRLDNLQELILAHNQLTTLPEKIFRGLNNLEKLEFHHNEFITLSEEIFRGLNNLRELGLDYDQLTTLPGGIWNGAIDNGANLVYYRK
jgi:Leucine-rich repeat (LRR) protein